MANHVNRQIKVISTVTTQACDHSLPSQSLHPRRIARHGQSACRCLAIPAYLTTTERPPQCKCPPLTTLEHSQRRRGGALWPQSPITTAPPAAAPWFSPTARCWMLRDSVTALEINPLLATCHALDGSFFLYCAVWSSKNPCVIFLWNLWKHVSSFKTTDIFTLRYEWMKCSFRIKMHF